MSFQRNSTLRQAFIDAKINLKKAVPAIADKVMNSIDRKVGLIRTRDWNVNASKRGIININQQCELDLK